MADYNSIYTGTQIDEAVGRASVGGAINTELAKLSAALSNKVNVTNGYIGNTKLVLDNATTPGHYLYIDGDCIFSQMSGWMYDICVSVQDFGGKIAIAQTATLVFGAEPLIYTRSYYFANIPAWTGWVQFATATPPQEFELPLADVVTGSVRYSKDQFGKLMIPCIHIVATRQIVAGATIATLPVGYRLRGAEGIRVLANLGNAIGNLYIDPNGILAVSAAVAQGEVICTGSISFVAN